MAVPNTTAFTLADVQTEISANGGGTITSLTEAFSVAISDGFVPSYEGSKNSLLNFRGYSHSTSRHDFTSSYVGLDTACSGSGESFIIRFRDGNSSYPLVGDTVYLNDTGSTTFNGLNKWYTLFSSDAVSYKVNTSGEIIDTYGCYEL